MPGLDPGIHQLEILKRVMGCRVKPGNDAVEWRDTQATIKKSALLDKTKNYGLFYFVLPGLAPLRHART
jgi:hypothetical protein